MSFQYNESDIKRIFSEEKEVRVDMDPHLKNHFEGSKGVGSKLGMTADELIEAVKEEIATRGFETHPNFNPRKDPDHPEHNPDNYDKDDADSLVILKGVNAGTTGVEKDTKITKRFNKIYSNIDFDAMENWKLYKDAELPKGYYWIKREMAKIPVIVKKAPQTKATTLNVMIKTKKEGDYRIRTAFGGPLTWPILDDSKGVATWSKHIFLDPNASGENAPKVPLK